MAEDHREYAEPVDPWATGEAAAVAAGHLPPTVPQWQPAGRPLRSRTGLWAGLAVATVIVLGAATGLVLWLRPAHPPIEFRPLTDPVRIAAPVPVSSSFAATAVRDGRAYFASGADEGPLGVVAADADTGAIRWRNQELTGRWESFAAVPGAVVLMTRHDPVTDTRRMMLLDPESGRLMWERPLGADDEVLFPGDIAVLVDRTENRLVGLAVRDRGKVAWEVRSPTSPYGLSTTAVLPVTTAADLAGPASPGGVPFAAAGGDGRIVQIGVDRSARVLDAATGKVVAGPRQSVADPDDAMVAHEGRLVVAESDAGSRLMAYDLDELGEPRTLFTPPDAATRLDKLTACGADRVCAVRTTGYDAGTARVVAIDAADSGQVWERAVPGAGALVPVGDAVLVSGESVTLLAADGRVTWARPGVAARLDAGNVLLFSKDLSTSADDPALTGVPVGKDPVPLGALAGVRSATCSWDTARLACVAAEDFVVQKFGE